MDVMCSSEESDKDDNKKKKFCIKDIKKLEKMKTSQIIDYVNKLHCYLEKREKKLKKYKTKFKTLEKKYKKLQKDALKETEVDSNSCNDTKTKSNRKEKQAHVNEDDELKDKLKLVKEIREVAESAQNLNGFVYEPTSGLYYDQKTGYYYNAEYGLYYDGNTGCYYKFHQDKNEFEFHSQVSIPSSKKEQAHQNDDYNNHHYNNRDNIVNDGKEDYVLSKVNRNRRYDNPIKKRRIHDETDDDEYDSRDSYYKEDGEISSSEIDDEDDYHKYDLTHYQDIAKKYPPSLRIIVQETNLDKIKVGTLYIITFKGGTLGREGDHDVLIPDINISKFHLKFTYNEEKEVYQCIDLGSRNGTLINGKRISPAKQESELTDIVHGSILQLSQTKLICHIHSGNTTCGLCEPGLLIDNEKDSERVELLTHKEQLKKLQKRYGLENEKYIEHKSNKGDNKYKDRASERRVKVGSSNHHEKTEVASTDTQISSTNKGFKLLSKLGWKEGEALGKEKDGLLQPVTVVANEGTSGLGANERKIPALSAKEIKNIKKWNKVKERYDNVSKTDMFNDSDSND